jgi:hydrogenase large subunit
MATISIDPVNRIEGHQKWEADCTDLSGISKDGYQINDARVRGMMFRGFELILLKRDPRDPIIICGRI